MSEGIRADVNKLKAGGVLADFEDADQAFRSVLGFFFNRYAGLSLVAGEWKSGKTDASLLLTETLLDWGVIKRAGSNIRTNESRIEFIDNVPAFKVWEYGDRTSKMFDLDEAGSHLYRRNAMSKKSVAILGLLPELSKGHVKLKAIFQDLESIDKDLFHNTWCTGLIWKPCKKTIQFISEKFPSSEKVYEFSDLPGTSIKFDPDEIAPFSSLPTGGLPTSLKDEDSKKLYEWAVNGKKWADVGLLGMQGNRLVRKFIKEHLLVETGLEKSRL